MPKVVKVKSQLKTNKNKAWLYTAFAVFFTLLFFIAGIVMLAAILLKKSALPIAFPIMFLCLSLVLLAIFTANRKKFAILKSGVQGEKTVLEVLKRLPKDYTVITNPVIYNRGKVNELDFVVIGKNGVFIVEAKNYRGIISGKTSQKSWKQTKHGKNDRVYEKEVGNPVKQAHRQGRIMLQVFGDFDISADVYPIVYFVDGKSVLRITDDAQTGVAVMNSEDMLLDYIVNTRGKNTVDSSELSKIIRFFKK